LTADGSRNDSSESNSSSSEVEPDCCLLSLSNCAAESEVEPDDSDTQERKARASFPQL
jgi:hypothetical protein